MQVGLEDPFPEDDHNILGSLDDIDPDVYRIPESPDEPIYAFSRYKAEYSPYQIYVPRKEIMLKLMRACLGCKVPSDLWFNKFYCEQGHRVKVEY